MMLPTAALYGVRRALDQLTRGSFELDHKLLHALIQLRPRQLGNRSLGPRISALENLRESSVRSETHHFELDVKLREPLANHWILGRGCAVAHGRAGQIENFLIDDAITHHARH